MNSLISSDSSGLTSRLMRDGSLAARLFMKMAHFQAKGGVGLATISEFFRGRASISLCFPVIDGSVKEFGISDGDGWTEQNVPANLTGRYFP